MYGFLGGAGARRLGFGPLYDVGIAIKVDGDNSEIVTGYDTIKGRFQLQVNGQIPFEFQNIRIQLEGTATVRFQTKIDNRLTNHMKDDRFLSASKNSDCVSNLTCHVLHMNDPKEKRTLGRGFHSFPFELKLNGEILPETFQSPFGRIQYKLQAYGDIWQQEFLLAEKALTTKGYFNLSIDPLLDESLTITRKKDKSFFSKRTILKVKLLLNKQGFLPGETMKFQLDVDNLTCEIITKIYISVLQRIIYFASKARKITTNLLDSQEISCNMNDAQVRHMSEFTLPEKLMPTFTKERTKSIEINYFMLFQVDINGKCAIKGETAIIVGTVRDDKAANGSVGNSINSAIRSANSSFDSNWDAISIQTCSTLPPAYSNLSSTRSSRRPSLETLPPTYDAVLGNPNWDDSNGGDLDDGFRPRCLSNVM